MAEHLLATGQRELVHQLYLLRLLGVVFDLCLDEYGVAGGIIPDMYAKGFDSYGICLDEADWPEDAKGLATLAEAPFRRTSTTNPR